jgi:hypothetical protein
MRRLLLIVLMLFPLADAALAADDPPSGNQGPGQGHDCHRPKPPETS